ncbi:MAG: chromosome segregation protein SMC, partial [Clostridia bacterium]
MYLKRIELQGFKSFADKTVIEVKQGITGIVGPNGSGKSNISDAIRWVMGEQSAKALRGGKMEDVIFNGTQKRKALGYAEVSMVFDNSSGFLPCEYAEVEITRRVFRSGDSDYMINRNPCRLKDIHELFMDTGMGRDGYSIVGQGKIAEIVSQKGEERRSVFEEAAGISKYRYRKQEAERKLAHTEDNLTRVRDILSELEGRVEPLRRQSEKAIKFLDLREELKEIEVSALLEIIDLKKTQLAEAEEKYEIAARQFEQAKQKHGEASAKSEELFESIKEKDGEIEKVREELSQAEAEGTALESRRSLIENNIANAKENILRTEIELENWAKRGEAIKVGLSEENAEKVRLEAKRDKLSGELEELENRLREATREMAARNNALEQAKTQVVELGQKKAEARTKIEGLEALRKTYESRAYSIDVDITTAKNDISNYTADIAELQKRQEAAALEKEQAAEELDKTTRAAAELNALIQEKKDECNASVSRFGEKNARLNMLKEMERSLEGYARSVKELVNDHRSRKYRGNMVGVLSKLIKTDKQYITAIEIALGGAMQNIVVKNEVDAKEAIEYLKRNRMGRITFLPISTQEGRRLDGEQRILSSRGAIAIASDLVTRDPSINGVVESLLGRTLIVDNMDNAALIAKENRYRFKIVTLAGELLQPGGSITGGSINKSQALLQRGEEIEALEKECASLDKQTEALENQIDDLMDKYNKSRQSIDAVHQKLAEAESRQSRLNAEAEMKRSLLDMTKERIGKLETEKEELAAKGLEADESKNELNSVLYGSDGLIAGAEKLVTS